MKYDILLVYILFTCTKIIAYQRTAIAEKNTRNNDQPAAAITAESFVDFVTKSNVFLDKSLLIKEILEDENKTILISRPRYWGKSLNLDMIKTFVDLPVDKTGKVIRQIEKTDQYRLFVEGEIISSDGKTQKLKKSLLVAEEKRIIDEYLGKYPVIYVDFSHLVEENFANTINAIKTRISNAFKKHDYMAKVFHEILKNDSTDEGARNVAQNRLHSFNNILQKANVNNEDLKGSLTFLSEILNDHFKTPAFILIDEYDAPSNLPFVNFNFPENERAKLFNFYTSFLVTTFKKNDHLAKGILTGRFPFTKEDLHGGLNGIAEYTFLNGKLMEYYGFNVSEINKISEVVDVSRNISEEANSCFGGYAFPDQGLFVYNPYFIVNIVVGKECHLWLDVDALKNFFKFYALTGVTYFQTFGNAFLHNDFGFPSGHSVDNDYLEGGHFARDELEIHHKALKCDYKEKEFKEKLSRFKIWDHEKYFGQHKDWLNKGQPSAEAWKFDYFKYLNKVWLFLYTQGYLSISEKNECIIYMIYPLKNPEKILPLYRHIKKQLLAISLLEEVGPMDIDDVEKLLDGKLQEHRWN